MTEHHPNPVIDRVVQYAYSEGWIHEWHQGAHAWATLHCHIRRCYMIVPLTHPNPKAAAESLEIKVHQCDH